MIQSYNIQGRVLASHELELEYSFTICGLDIRQEIYGYEFDASDEGMLRLFSQGNQIHIRKDGIFHAGCGGSFCEYMFGLQVPTEDLLREDVRNRLVLFGALPGKVIKFSDKSDRFDSFTTIFANGHLFANYYFFVTFDDGVTQAASLSEKQMTILRLAGKTLKHSMAVANYNDVAMQKLSQTLQSALQSEQVKVFLLRLFDRKTFDCYQAMRERAIQSSVFLADQEPFYRFAQSRGIDRFSAERMRLDVAYKLEDNRKLLDRYKNELVSSSGSVQKMAEVRRLRVLCLRKNIPKELLASIEQKLPEGRADRYRTEPIYINEARRQLQEEILDYTQKTSGSNPANVPNKVIRTLFSAKYKADQEGSKSFEQLLIDYGHRIDNTRDSLCAERFSQVLKYLDCYDLLTHQFNALVFIDNTSLTAKTIVALRNAYKTFITVSLDDLGNYIIMPILENLYATQYGKEKLHILLEMLELPQIGQEIIAKGEKAIQDICYDEHCHQVLDRFIRDNIKIFYLESNSEHERDGLRRRISAQLRHDKKNRW